MISTSRSSPGLQHAPQESTAHDENLLLAAKAGSHSAFAELQSIYSRRLYNRIFSITRNREDAEDALQDTFLRAYRALPTFEGRARFSSWLTRIAINSALMTIRRRRARPETSLEEQHTFADGSCGFEVHDSALSPEENCDQKQRSDAILNAVLRLDPKLRIPLDIWMSEEYSMKDLAQHLGMSVATVKSRLHRARKRLNHYRNSTNYKSGPSQCNRGASTIGTPQSRQIHRELSETLRCSRAQYCPLFGSQPLRSDSLRV
jgi:RNA polymerase sigma-70 factor, ECF subfamily